MSEDSDSDPGPSVVGIIRFDVVEEAPSHDDTPCISVWEDKKAEDERLAKWVQGGRPKYTIQIYDTTPNSRDDLRHLKTLALKLHKDTYKDRMGRGDPDREDRLDVYGLAMPAGTSDEDRVKQCIAHQEVEIISRNSTGKSDFYISGTYDAQSYQRFLVIIDGDINIQTDADPDESPFLVVFWGFPEKARQEIMSIYDSPIDDPESYRISPDDLGSFISSEMKPHIGWFYNSYVPDGLLEKEIARYVQRREENEKNGNGATSQRGLLEMEPDT